MKKIAIAVVAGLLFMIGITPFLLGQAMGAGMLSWVEKQKSDGVTIQNTQQNSGYLSSTIAYDMVLDSAFVSNHESFAVNKKWVDGLGLHINVISSNMPSPTPEIEINLTALPKPLLLLKPLLTKHPLALKLHSKKLKRFSGDIYLGDTKLNGEAIVFDATSQALLLPIKIEKAKFDTFLGKYPLLQLLQTSSIITLKEGYYESSIRLHDGSWSVNEVLR